MTTQWLPVSPSGVARLGDHFSVRPAHARCRAPESAHVQRLLVPGPLSLSGQQARFVTARGLTIPERFERSRTAQKRQSPDRSIWCDIHLSDQLTYPDCSRHVVAYSLAMILRVGVVVHACITMIINEQYLILCPLKVPTNVSHLLIIAIRRFSTELVSARVTYW
jgi:hypothetical protein